MHLCSLGPLVSWLRAHTTALYLVARHPLAMLLVPVMTHEIQLRLMRPMSAEQSVVCVQARDDGLSRFGFHTAFRLPGDPGGPEGHRTRRSLASRLLLLFDKPDEPKL